MTELTKQELSDMLVLYSSKGNINMMRKLLLLGADPVYNNDLPLQCAVEADCHVAVYLLLSKGASPSSALLTAAKCNNIHMLEILLEKGASISDPNIVIGAIQGNNPNVLLFAISRGAELFPTNNPETDSPFTLALQAGNEEIIKIVQDHLLFAPLVDFNKIDLVKSLVKLDASLDKNKYPNYSKFINSLLIKTINL